MARVTVEDGSLRDGLQPEPKVLRLEDKLTLFRLLAAAGVKRVQVGSFVHPTIVPQMADTDELVRTVKNEVPGVLVTALVLNDKGLERALACGIGHLSMSSSASDSHSLKQRQALSRGGVRQPAWADPAGGRRRGRGSRRDPVCLRVCR